MRLLVRAAILLAFCWLCMMWVHEAGHVLAAVASGGRVDRVVLAPWAFSRTDVSANPWPQTEIWAGPVVGVAIPWMAAGVCWLVMRRVPGVIVLLAGFCGIANGGYMLYGAIDPIGDAGALLSQGAARWQLSIFGVLSVAGGLAFWHSLGRRLGLERRYPGRSVLVTAVSAAVMALVGVIWFAG